MKVEMGVAWSTFIFFCLLRKVYVYFGKKYTENGQKNKIMYAIIEKRMKNEYGIDFERSRCCDHNEKMYNIM